MLWAAPGRVIARRHAGPPMQIAEVRTRPVGRLPTGNTPCDSHVDHCPRAAPRITLPRHERMVGSETLLETLQLLRRPWFLFLEFLLELLGLLQRVSLN